MDRVGVDWAGTAWVAAARTAGGWRVDHFPTILGVWHRHRDADSILVDVPVGLPADGRRACDERAKAVLGSRHGSVFPTPCREAVYASTYEAAKAANERATGDSVPIQAWNLVPRIREVDTFLREVPAARGVVREAHPEVCFRALAGDDRELASKATAAGLAERLSLLDARAPGARSAYEDAVREFVDRPVPQARPLPADGHDDVVDALGLAATATGETAALGGETDARGLPMEIVHPEPAPDDPAFE